MNANSRFLSNFSRKKIFYYTLAYFIIILIAFSENNRSNHDVWLSTWYNLAKKVHEPKKQNNNIQNLRETYNIETKAETIITIR